MAKKKLQTKDRTDWFSQADELGDPFAIDQCVVSHFLNGQKLPKWAHAELAWRSWQRLKASERRLHKKFPGLPSIVNHLFGSDTEAKLKRSRSGRRYSVDALRRPVLIAYIEAARSLGLRGMAAFQLAIDRLSDLNIAYDVRTAEKLYPKLRGALRPLPDALEMWVDDLVEWRARRSTRTKHTGVSSARRR
jgi:hypothetical protein